MSTDIKTEGCQPFPFSLRTLSALSENNVVCVFFCKIRHLCRAENSRLATLTLHTSFSVVCLFAIFSAAQTGLFSLRAYRSEVIGFTSIAPQTGLFFLLCNRVRPCPPTVFPSKIALLQRGRVRSVSLNYLLQGSGHTSETFFIV